MGSGNDIKGLGAQQKRLQLKLGTVTSMLNVHVQLEALDHIPSIPQSQQDQDRCSQDWLIGMTAMWMQKWDTPLNNHSQLTFVATWDIELHNSGKLPVNLQSTSARFCIWTTATQVSLQEGNKLTSAKSHVCCPALLLSSICFESKKSRQLASVTVSTRLQNMLLSAWKACDK